MTRVHSQGHSLRSVCKYVGISTQGYYKRLRVQRSKQGLYQRAEQLVVKNRKTKSRAGLRTIYYKEDMSSLLGVNQYEKQMSSIGYALKPYKSYIKTTDSRGHYYRYDNLISGTEVHTENQVMVGDITYYQSSNALYYIFHFVDYYTLEVKGLIGSKNMEGIYAEKCLREVFRYNGKSKYNHRMILHTDAGSQYRSHSFQKLLRSAQIRPSHAQNCLENGLSERQNGVVKNEYLVDYDIMSVSHLNRVLKAIKYQINEVWPSPKLGYKTPKQYAQKMRSMSKRERPIKKVKTVS